MFLWCCVSSSGIAGRCTVQCKPQPPFMSITILFSLAFSLFAEAHPYLAVRGSRWLFSYMSWRYAQARLTSPSSSRHYMNSALVIRPATHVTSSSPSRTAQTSPSDIKHCPTSVHGVLCAVPEYHPRHCIIYRSSFPSMLLEALTAHPPTTSHNLSLFLSSFLLLPASLNSILCISSQPYYTLI